MNKDEKLSIDAQDSINPSDLWFDILSTRTPDNLFIVRIDAQLNYYFHWANESLEKATGISLEKNQGKMLKDILGEEIASIVQTNYRRCLDARKPIEYEETSELTHGQVRYWHTLLVPKIDSTGNIPFIYGVSRNITEIVKLKIQAEKANQIKTDFLAHLSHEVKTPLNSTAGALSLLQSCHLNQKEQDYLNIIAHSHQAITHITSDILSYAQLEAGALTFNHTPFNLLTLLDSVSAIMSNSAREKRLNLNIGTEDCASLELTGDCNRIKQILCNLLSNAIKYTHEGDISLVAKGVSIEPLVIEFTVTDQGIGIAPENLDKLFKPYSRIQDIHAHGAEGTGLGLAITKKLVEGMEGTISVNSEPSKGSEFVVTLPFTQGANVTLDLSSRTPPKHYNGYKLLIAEDDRMSRIVLQAILEEMGIEVTALANGQLALEACKNERYDLIILDWLMPELNGADATQAIRTWEEEQAYSTPIIGLTANADTPDAHKLFDAGMNAVLSKPINKHMLVSTFSDWLHSPKRT